MSDVNDDIAKPPYTILFNQGTSALRMWLAVEIMRAVDVELKAFQVSTEGKPKLIATHGNRFVLHMVLRSALDPNNADLEATRKAVPKAVESALASLIAATIVQGFVPKQFV